MPGLLIRPTDLASALAEPWQSPPRRFLSLASQLNTFSKTMGRQWALGCSLAVVAGLVGWGVWHGQTLLLQVCVIAATGIYGLAGYLDDFYGAGWHAAASMLVAGACMGALAYHGEVGLLLAIGWLALVIWIEVGIRHWLSDVLGGVADLLS